MRDPSDDSRTDLLAVALGKEFPIGPNVALEHELLRTLVHDKQTDVVVSEVALNGLRREAEDLIRVEGGQDQTGNLIDQGELCGALSLQLQEMGDLVATPQKIRFRPDPLADVRDHPKAAHDVPGIVSQGNAGDGDRGLLAALAGQFGLVDGGLSGPHSQIELVLHPFQALVLEDERSVFAQGLLVGIARDLLHAPVEEGET